MKKEFSKNTTEVFVKTIFHYVPEILKYIDEIKEPRKRLDYTMRYLIMSEMLMFLSEGKSQRFTETAYEDTKYLENIGKIIKEDIRKIPDSEIYTNVFSKIAKEEIEKKSIEEIKQDCELNASRRLIPKFRESYPRLPVRKIADSLYPSISLIELCEKENIEYIFVLKDKKIPTLLRDFYELVSMPEGNRKLTEDEEKITLTLWENEIDYKEKKINVIRQIIKNKKTEKYSIWMWITNREITRKIYCAKLRDYIENQGFKEQKVTSGIDLEHVYSKNINAIKVIYTIIQITHLILQIIEHSDICGDFTKKYGSVKVFRRKFYAHLTEKQINIELIKIKIQIRFDKSLMIY